MNCTRCNRPIPHGQHCIRCQLETMRVSDPRRPKLTAGDAIDRMRERSREFAQSGGRDC